MLKRGIGLASIFLSYAREDAAKARTLAKALERAGHSVWWDRQIFGGSEFSDEIEAALKEADVVIVLWSEAAVRSAWVRDEAAEGRDSGRLVPVMLEGCAPPLGFRQVQSISLAGWQGRGNPPHLQEILNAVAKRAGTALPVPAGGADRAGRRLPVKLVIAVLAALLLAAGGWWLLRPASAKAETPVIAVMPFSDLSQGGDRAYLSEGVAEAILTVLAKEPGISVIGRSSAQQLHQAGAAAPEMRRAMGITHVLEGSARSLGDQLRMSVRLINAADGQQIWAEEYDRRLDNIFAVQDEIGRAVAARLKGSFAPRRLAEQQTSADAYTLYLAARAKMRDRTASSLQDALKLARQVIAADPNYAPGHALYAELITHQSYDNYGNLSPERVRQMALPHASEAIRLAPNAAEGYAAFGMVANGDEAIEPLNKAIRLDPARGELRLWLAHAYHLVGKNEEAFRQVQAATQMEPLWPTVITMEAGILAASERYAEAEAVIRRYEQRGGSSARAAKVRGDIAAWYRGDYSEGVNLIRRAVRAEPELPLANQSLAWFYGKLGLHDQAGKAAKDFPTYTRLYLSGDVDRLLAQSRRDGALIWRQPDPDIVVDALAFRRDWAAIEALYDGNRDSLKLVCSDNRGWNLSLGLHIATALENRNRTAEAKRFINCVKSGLEKSGRSPFRSPYMSNGALDFFWANVHAFEGRPDQAFALVERSIRRGLRTQYGRGLIEYPVFDRFRGMPAYGRLELQMNERIARERAETLQLPAA